MKVVRGLSRQGIRRSSGVVDQHVEAAMAFADGVDQPSHRVLVADVAGMELVRQTVDGVSCAGDHDCALFGENRTDTAPTPRTPPVTRTTRPAKPKLTASAPSGRVTVLAYQASACLGSQPVILHRKWPGIPMPITSTTQEPGI